MTTLPPYNWLTWKNPCYVEPNMDKWLAAQVESWRRYIKPSDHCIDIGALTGDTTLPMAMLAGPAGRVIAFEPNPHVLPITRFNCTQSSPISPIVLVEAAADTQIGTATFHYNDSDYCNGGQLLTIRDYKVKHVAPLAVPTVPLKPFITRLVQFIKIDTEGNDHRILESCVEELRAWHPTIQTEIYMDTDAVERVRYVQFLIDLGYKLFYTSGDPISTQQIVEAVHLDIIATTHREYGSDA